jgi:hypothetical protein
VIWKKHKSSAQTSHLDLEMGMMWLKRKQKKNNEVYFSKQTTLKDVIDKENDVNPC